jgi:tetratricopeptide (TPR) repeat protein
MFAKRASEVDPTNTYCWSNLGMLNEQLYRFDEAENCFRKALNYAKLDSQKGIAYLNWACMLINKGDYVAGETMARRALKYSPNSVKAKANLGMACLALRNWKEGWPLYDAIIGFDGSRRKMQYAGESVWDGSPDKRIVVYGEQGLGDEISFASMLPDAIKTSKSVVIDCTDRLAGLFRRSFPEATVYGTRWEKGLGWNRKDQEIDASVSIGGLGKLFRKSDEDFPGTPYLKADPDRVEMWKALFAKAGKPVIGIAWSGGVAWTGDRYRSWTLEQLLPVFQSVDAVWVSLQYKDASKEIESFKSAHPEIDLRQYAFGTLTQDYDDTAALVDALDLVFTMQTAVVHLAGGLGKTCMTFVPKGSQWRYGTTEKTLPWYKSVKLYRQAEDWPWAEAITDLRAHLHRV